MRKGVIVCTALSALIGVALAQRLATAQQQPGAPASTSGIDLEAMDRTADACSDFYQFACGAWLAKHPLPADRSTYGRFNELQDRNNEILHQILEKASSATAPDPDTKKIGDYYSSCMDESGISARGLAPLKEDLDRIASLKRISDLPPVVASLHVKGVHILFDFGSTPDFKDASTVIAAADQGGMG